MAEFDWWLLVLGLVVGGGLVYLVLADGARREADVEADELDAEATWIVDRLAEHGVKLPRADVVDVLHEHRAYLALPPPDEIIVADPEFEPTERAEISQPGERTRPARPGPLPGGESTR